MAIRLHLGIKKEPLEPVRKMRAIRMLYIMYAVLFLITVRIIFRLVEWSNGLDSTIPNHEVYLYVFDSTPMLIALVLLNIVHPGYIMPGKEGDFPSRKERKNMFKNPSQTQRSRHGDTERGHTFDLVPTTGGSSRPVSPMPKGSTHTDAYDSHRPATMPTSILSPPTYESAPGQQSGVSYGYAVDVPRQH